MDKNLETIANEILDGDKGVMFEDLTLPEYKQKVDVTFYVGYITPQVPDSIVEPKLKEQAYLFPIMCAITDHKTRKEVDVKINYALGHMMTHQSRVNTVIQVLEDFFKDGPDNFKDKSNIVMFPLSSLQYLQNK